METKTKTRIAVISIALTCFLAACNPPPPPSPPPPPDCVMWDEAIKYVGEFKTVCGPVVDTAYASSSSGKPTFLNLGRSYPDPERFTVVIWGRNRDNFPNTPESHYRGRDVCVNGLIELYKGDAQIEARNASQIEIQ